MSRGIGKAIGESIGKSISESFFSYEYNIISDILFFEFLFISWGMIIIVFIISKILKLSDPLTLSIIIPAMHASGILVGIISSMILIYFNIKPLVIIFLVSIIVFLTSLSMSSMVIDSDDKIKMKHVLLFLFITNPLSHFLFYIYV